MSGAEKVDGMEEEGVQIWTLFDKVGSSAVCKKCMKVILTTNGNTSGVHAHANNVHGIKTVKRKRVTSSAVGNNSNKNPRAN